MKLFRAILLWLIGIEIGGDICLAIVRFHR